MTDTIVKMKTAELVEDFQLYPRSQVDGSHVAKIVHAMEAGEKMPPIVIDEKSKRIIDGWHRRRATIRIHGDAAEIDVISRSYKDEAEMYVDAAKLNARHGKGITGAEETGAILKAQRLNIDLDIIASALGITQERAEKITQTKVGKVTVVYGKKKKEEEIPLKRSVHHLKKLTQKQADAMSIYPGQPQVLLVKQLNALIETGAIDLKHHGVVGELKKLKEFLGKLEL